MRKPRTIRPASCQCCTHVDRARLEMMRCNGASLDAVAATFGVSRDSVFRHFRSHVSDRRRAELMAGPMQVEDLAAAAALESKSTMQRLEIVGSVLFRQFLNAAEAGDRPGVANVGARLLDALRDQARLAGELRQLSGVTINQSTVNLIASPQFVALQEGLLRVARAHPDAKADIVSLLRGLDDQPLKAGLGAPPAAMIEAEAVDVS